MSHHHPQNPYAHFFAAFMAGGTSAAIALTATAPIERVKLILQTQSGTSYIPKDQEYKGIIDCFVRIPKEQGVLAFWRGNWASVVRAFPFYAMNFSFKDLIKDYLLTESDDGLKKFGGNVLAGGLAGVAALTIVYPLDYARTRMAVDIGNKGTRRYKGVTHCIKESYRRGGFRRLYSGYWFSVFGAFVYRSLYFGLYDSAMEIDFIEKSEYRSNIFVEFSAAEFAAVIAGFMSYPMDTIRRRMMVQDHDPCSKSEKSYKYKNTWDCCTRIYKAHGARGFYQGAGANILRGTGGAIMLVSYDRMQHFLFTGTTFLSSYINLKESPPPSEDVKKVPDINLSDYKACKMLNGRCVFCTF